MKLYAEGVVYHAEIHQNNSKLPHLILFHGFMGSGRAFSNILSELKAFCNPVTIDLIGHGKTITPDDVNLFSAERQTEQSKSILDRFQFKNLYVYGYSMGGRLLFQLLTSIPSYFRGALIESSHCGIDDESTRKERVEVDQKRALEIERDFETFLDRWMGMPLFQSEDQTSSLLYRNIMEDQSPRNLAYSLKGFGAGVMPPVCEKLHQLRVPLYLMAGSNDQKYVDRMTEISKLSSHFELIVAENAGHRVHADRPDLLIKSLKKLISTHV
ncbi:alpha/beta fold hydrolase [Rhodohalobacter halophilus]|uniref:alpha/beta fold hydrolase n=1 Tax=Rhodohalobacter halophilus TaxID=1812810 RepID=UPI00083F59D2|nr:alpha/beta fold hydrolase [Rhodohalobacter halophilus]